MTRGRMESSADDGGEEEVEQGVGAVEIHQREIVGELDRQIERDDFIGSEGLDKTRPERIKGELGEHKEGLQYGAVPDDVGLEGVRDIGIHAVHTLRTVMIHMVRLERTTVRNPDRKVGEHAPDFVVQRFFKPEIVGPFVDG
mmetsp:Transcript_34495/g.39907  ORF Transcript_34495/g.39907 Transcript_34495/m.39907 type:complete len:142 (+) Transcript_34495:644-1069(+)